MRLANSQTNKHANHKLAFSVEKHTVLKSKESLKALNSVLMALQRSIRTTTYSDELDERWGPT